MTKLAIRAEAPGDAETIAALTASAFRSAPQASGTEAAIIAALRLAGTLELSLVAEEAQELVGQITFSPVTIDGRHDDWFGLGPVSVLPDRQGIGIGSRLVREGLARLRSAGERGCVLIGNPAYYSRFGFVGDTGLTYADVPAKYIQQLAFQGPFRTGVLRYAEAFEQAAGGSPE